ncbi:MAG: hypothetical protein K6C69_02675 [Lachnospiraceae bacterium]|nr:hypothetical protein [Lachnospiraceae bacterium]
MTYTVSEATNKMLSSYEAYYNVHPMEGPMEELVARCDYFSHTEGKLLSKNDPSYRTYSEEFIYLFQCKHLTLETLNKFLAYIQTDGAERMNVGQGHMFTYLTPVIICETSDEEAIKALRKIRIFKSFRFSFHGWMEVHAAMLEVNNSNTITTNRSGKSVGKVLKSVLLSTKKRRRL